MEDRIPVVTEDDDTDIIGFQVEGHTSDAGPELHHFSGLYFVETDHTGNTITDADDSAEFLHIILDREASTTWVMFMIFYWMTLAVSAMPSFLEKPCLANLNNGLIFVEK